jgi:anti-repressor protein
MNNLIPIKEYQGRKVVSARELHAFLESKKDFSDWIKQRVQKYGLVDRVDFTTFQGKSTGGRPQVEYALTLEAAKELAMVEGNSKGKEARQYFIECEKAIKQVVQNESPEALVRRAMAYLESKVEQQKQIIEAQAPKVEYVEKVLDSQSTWTITTIAKELGVSAVDLNRRLQELEVQFKVDGHWVLKAKYQGKGYTDTRTHYVLVDGNPTTRIQTVWTEAGRKFIHDLMNFRLSLSHKENDNLAVVRK